VPTSDWKPQLTDVGAILRARTKDSVGNELGTFNAETRPTDQQVLILIGQGVSDVAMIIGSDIPTVYWQDAVNVAALATALKIELSYFPEQINTGRSPYPQLKQLFDDQAKRLLVAIEGSGAETPGAGGPMKPAYGFPVPRPNLEGWRTPGYGPTIPGNSPGRWGW
jgi:hypothetical protein